MTSMTSGEYSREEARLFFNVAEQDSSGYPFVPDWSKVRLVVLCAMANQRDSSVGVVVLEPNPEQYQRLPRMTVLSCHDSAATALFVGLELVSRWESANDREHPPLRILTREQLSHLLDSYRHELQ